MDNQTYTYYQPQQPIESASGTTSPDNSKSGPVAYIVTIVCVVVLIAICAGTAQCVNKTINAVLPRVLEETMDRVEIELSDPETIERIIDDEGLDADNFDDYFEQIFGEPYEDYFNIDLDGRDSGDGWDPSDDGDGYEFDSRDVLGLDLAIYDWNIDDMVSANAYAGADADVRDFVRDLVLADREATEDLIREFRRAGREGEDFNAHLEEALKIASDTRSDLSAMELPDTNEETEELLNEAVEHAKARWAAIGELIETLFGNDTVSDQDLEALDDTIYYETRNAAQALEDALAASRD